MLKDLKRNLSAVALNIIIIIITISYENAQLLNYDSDFSVDIYDKTKISSPDATRNTSRY